MSGSLTERAQFLTSVASMLASLFRFVDTKLSSRTVTDPFLLDGLFWMDFFYISECGIFWGRRRGTPEKVPQIKFCFKAVFLTRSLHLQSLASKLKYRRLSINEFPTIASRVLQNHTFISDFQVSWGTSLDNCPLPQYLSGPAPFLTSAARARYWRRSGNGK